MRLNQWLVRAGAAPARRKADEIVTAGRVLVNGRLPEMGYQVQDTDRITLDGQVQALQASTGKVVLFNKPPGVISSHEQQGTTLTLFSLLPPEYASWKIVGRLDKDSEGLMVLSDDGAVVQALGHPSAGHAKHYRVWLDRPLEQGSRWQLEAGVPLEEGLSQFTRIEAREDPGVYDLWLITGWNRQIRRTFEALGYTINRLQRLEHGPYQLGALAPGAWVEQAAVR